MSDEVVIRVLIADDHPIVREGIAALVARRKDMQVVGEAANGREAVELFRQHRPDVTLMDMRMPEMDGVAAITRILKEFPLVAGGRRRPDNRSSDLLSARQGRVRGDQRAEW